MSRGPRSPTARRDWGSDESGAGILHVDMDAFFASVELVRRPELRGRPVIVGGRERGVVLAATYEARAFGVRSAMPMTHALARCPQAVVVRPDHRRYREVSASVMEMLREVTAVVEQVSVDEAFLDVSGARRRMGPPTTIGRLLRERVQAEHGITCSVGIGRNKLVAKLASTHAKPDGMLLVPEAATLAFLRGLPVGALWGVGDKTEQVLRRWGITTVAQLADTDVDVLQAAVGRVTGAHLHDLALGRDPRPVVADRAERSIGAETTFERDLHDREDVARRLRELADRVTARLRRHDVVARTVALKVRTSDFRTLTRSRTLDAPTDVAQEFYRVARELFGAVDLRGLPVRLVGVRAEGLRPRADLVTQPSLFDGDDPHVGARREAEVAVDAVRARFGDAAIALGASPVPPPTTVRGSAGLS